MFDASSNPLPGVNVQFVSSAGALGSTTAVTDSNGTARTTLNTSQTATVTAIAGAAKGEVRVEVSAAPTLEIVTDGTGVVGVPEAITVNTTSGNTSAPRQVATLVVEFGDGQSETRSNVTGSSAFTHTYRSEGGFTVTARAVDVAGNTAIASKPIVVTRQQNPTVTLSAPATTTAATPITVTFSGTATAPAQLVSARVALQDGTVIYSGSQPNTFNYKFGGSGTYTLTGTVTDSNGNSATTSTTVFVTP